VDYSDSDSSKYTIPDKGADPVALKQFAENFFNSKSPGRIELLSEMYLSKAMFESVQWVQRESGQVPGRTPRWTHQASEDADEIPKPVTNVILLICDNEIARLRNRKSKPKVKVSGSETDEGRLGASKVDHVLNSHLNRRDWDLTRRRFAYRTTLFGTGILKSYLEQNWLDTIKVGKSAWKCAGSCNFMLADKVIDGDSVITAPPEIAGKLQRNDRYSDAKAELVSTFSAEKCFDCGAPLKHYTPTPDEAMGDDMFGRALGMPAPMNDVAFEDVSPFEMFFENEGIGVDPRTISQWGQETPRSLDWIAAHYGLTVKGGKYFNAKGEELRAEDAGTIAGSHSIVGQYGHGMNASRNATERNLYKNYARVREFYSLPTPRHPEGRAFVVANNIVLLDDDYLIKSQDDPELKIPRVVYSCARYLELEGQLNGQGLPVPLISPQRRINMTFSQIIMSRERTGNPSITATRGMRLRSPGYMRGYPGYIMEYDPDPEFPDKTPTWSSGHMIAPEVYNELDHTIALAKEIAGLQDPEVGKLPTSVWQPTAIKLLQDKASERRDQRIAEMNDAEKAIWEHQLLLLREFVREPRPYRFLNENSGKWESGLFEGKDLAGEYELEVEDEPSFDDTAFERDSIIQAKNQGIISANTPYSRYVLAKQLGVNPDAAGEENTQVEDALRKWYKFRDTQEVPAIDQTEDEHSTHWQIYGKQFKGEDGIRLKSESGWDEILKLLGPAQDDIDPMTGMPLGNGWQTRLSQERTLSMQIEAQMKEVMQNPAMMAPGMEQLFQRPPFPKAIEDQIHYVWKNIVQAGQQAAIGQQATAGGVGGMGGGVPQPLPINMDHPFVKMKAVAEGHRMIAEARAMPAPVPAAAAPGGQATPTGMAPTDQAQVPGQEQMVQ